MTEAATTIPENIDILYIRTESENSITVALGDERFGPYPSSGGLSLAAKEMHAKHPEIWSSSNACGTALIVLHFAFMSKNKNAAGMDYPYRGVSS